jgi:tripartite ATP-independent transporter DctP family solute receptor
MRRPTITRRAAIGAVACTLAVTTARAATVLRWATVLPGTHPETAMMQTIAADVHTATGGALDIQVFPAGQLGGSRDSVESVSSGALQMVSEGAAQFGQFTPPLSILEAPYLWRDVAHMHRVLASPVMVDLSDMLVAHSHMRVLGATYYGTRQLTTGSRPVHTVADMNGFKLRIPEVDTYVTMTEAWGARPTPLNFGELYLALSQGAVDGEENPLPTIQSAKLQEVQKYLVLTAHILTPRLIAVNEAVWQRLTGSQQAALHTAIATHAPQQDQVILDQEESLRKTFATGGMQIIAPDVESFRRPVLAVLPKKFEARWGKGLWDRIAAA